MRNLISFIKAKFRSNIFHLEKWKRSVAWFLSSVSPICLKVKIIILFHLIGDWKLPLWRVQRGTTLLCCWIPGPGVLRLSGPVQGCQHKQRVCPQKGIGYRVHMAFSCAYLPHEKIFHLNNVLCASESLLCIVSNFQVQNPKNAFTLSFNNSFIFWCVYLKKIYR